MGGARRKKKRTHDLGGKQGPPLPEDKVPKSFVLGRGKLPPPLQNLRHDLRKLMMPHTAMNLKESNKNTMRDFVHVASPLGVTHFMIISNTTVAPYLRIARSPHGPTLTFKIHSYTLAADITNAQSRPRAPASIYKTPPLLVMNGLNTGEEHLKLAIIMLQNMFPAINVHTVKLATCQRVLLLNYDKKTKLFDFRHYSISAQPTGVSRNIRKLVQRKKLPDLSNLTDVSEFVSKSGYGSESEAEDQAAKVELPDEYGKGNHASQQSAVKLHEVGPRMTLQLVKVEEGLCDGDVMFHEYVKKTPEEVAVLRALKEQREALRKQRRAEQEANVKRKEEERSSRKKRKFVEQKVEHAAEEDAAEDDEAGMSADEPQEEEIDDAEWYRREVGEEPDEGFLTGSHQRRPVKFVKKFSAKKEGSESGNKDNQFRPEKRQARRPESRPGGNFGRRLGKNQGNDNKRYGELQERGKKPHSGGGGSRWQREKGNTFGHDSAGSSRKTKGASREGERSNKRFKKSR